MPGPTWLPMTGEMELRMTMRSSQPGSLRTAFYSQAASLSASVDMIAMGSDVSCE